MDGCRIGRADADVLDGQIVERYGSADVPGIHTVIGDVGERAGIALGSSAGEGEAPAVRAEEDGVAVSVVVWDAVATTIDLGQ